MNLTRLQALRVGNSRWELWGESYVQIKIKGLMKKAYVLANTQLIKVMVQIIIIINII